MFQINALVRGIEAIIPGEITTTDFSVVARTDQISAKEILNVLTANNIGTLEGNYVHFTKGDKLKTALFALEEGAPIEEVSTYIEWRDFEGLVAEILNSKGFHVVRNLVLTKPRLEIDVIGKNNGISLLIDCKHWNRQSPSSLENTVQKQIQRVKHYVSQTKGAKAIPAVVTLHDEQINFVDKVPIVPILQFSSFVDELYGNLEELNTIET